MPTYDYLCTACGFWFEDVQTMANRDAPCNQACVWCAGRVERSMVYEIRIATNEASVWPQNNNALVPTDPAMEARYRSKGWLVKDPADPRGEIVKCESDAHFKHMCKEQGLKTDGDYEKLNRSGPSRRKKPGKMKDRPDQKKAREKARKELRERGLLK